MKAIVEPRNFLNLLCILKMQVESINQIFINRCFLSKHKNTQVPMTTL